jgi:hypothetical protein
MSKDFPLDPAQCIEVAARIRVCPFFQQAVPIVLGKRPQIVLPLRRLCDRALMGDRVRVTSCHP